MVRIKKILGRAIYCIGGLLPHGKSNEFPVSQTIRRCAGKLLFNESGRYINIGRKCRLSNNISMGNESSLGDGAYVSGTLIIGESTMIAPQCVFLGIDHVFDEETLDNNVLAKKNKPIKIGSHSWLGYGVKVLSGVNIGDYVIVGAGAVVTKDVESYCVVGGVPAKVIKKRNPIKKA